jgi:hypothetical protein
MTYHSLFVACILGLVPASYGQVPGPTPILPERILISDPLRHATIGTLRGEGEFHPAGGWRSLKTGQILYDAGERIHDGYFEATLAGWALPLVSGPAKANPLSAWETPDGPYDHEKERGCLWTWRIGRGYEAFKFVVANQAIRHWSEANLDEASLIPDPRSHRYRVDWRQGEIRFLLDNHILHTEHIAGFGVRVFALGKDDRYGVADPSPVFSDVIIAARQETLLVNDPLDLTTTGAASGRGTFLSTGGWHSDGNGRLIYDLGGLVADGFVEVAMTGWHPGADQGVTKAMPISGWQTPRAKYHHSNERGAYFAWRTGTEVRSLKLEAAPNPASVAMATPDLLPRITDGGRHLYRVDWRDGRVEYRLDGELVQAWNFPRFALRVIVLGKDDMYGVTTPAPIFSDLKIGTRARVAPTETPLPNTSSPSHEKTPSAPAHSVP